MERNAPFILDVGSVDYALGLESVDYAVANPPYVGGWLGVVDAIALLNVESAIAIAEC